MKLRIWFCLFFPTLTLPAVEYRMEINLQGGWRFEIGDNSKYANPGYDDSDWENISVPSLWENQGFPGYDGFSWYRIEVKIPRHLRDRQLYLKLGRIDDVDRTFWNGTLIGGEGEFPPKIRTAYDVKRCYRIPPESVKFGGRNVIAVRVYDMWLGGGIVEGEVGVYSKSETAALDVVLDGDWKFTTGDDPRWAMPETADASWETVKTPCYWESQGHPEYNGFAWYRKTIRIPHDLIAAKLILLLGKIDDLDQTFFNGTLIGNTGRFRKEDSSWEESYKEERAYFIPAGLIREDKPNVIAVRVLDTGGSGGIYEGPIGIITRDKYLQYQNRKK
jgi:hypothetical protein